MNRHAGTPTQCEICSATLGPHNLTSKCRECKFIARNRRLTGQPADTAEPVTEAEAFTNVLGGIHQPHRYDAPCKCGKALARTDTGKCEWCTAKAAPPKPERTP